MHQNCILNVFDVHFLEEMNSMVYFASLSKGPPEILEDPFLCNKGFRLCECSWSLPSLTTTRAALLVCLCTALVSIFHSIQRTYFVA